MVILWRWVFLMSEVPLHKAPEPRAAKCQCLMCVAFCSVCLGIQPRVKTRWSSYTLGIQPRVKSPQSSYTLRIEPRVKSLRSSYTLEIQPRVRRWRSTRTRVLSQECCPPALPRALPSPAFETHSPATSPRNYPAPRTGTRACPLHRRRANSPLYGGVHRSGIVTSGVSPPPPL